MTCTHVLDLIDAGPLVDYPQAHLDAAWQHARACATCGPALAAATVLGRELSALPQLTAPPDMRATILSRIEQIEHINQAEPAGALATGARAAVAAGAHDWSAWAPIGGLIVGLAIVLLGSAASPTIVSFRSTWTGLSSAASPTGTATGALVLAAGLMFYVAGLFAPLREWKRS